VQIDNKSLRPTRCHATKEQLTGGFGVCGNVLSFDEDGSNEIPASLLLLFIGVNDVVD
jgi:hypothetical protein